MIGVSTFLLEGKEIHKHEGVGAGHYKPSGKNDHKIPVKQMTKQCSSVTQSYFSHIKRNDGLFVTYKLKQNI